VLSDSVLSWFCWRGCSDGVGSSASHDTFAMFDISVQEVLTRGGAYAADEVDF
jgi:hypothetical protein